MAKGKFITIDGLDYSGKSTLIRGLEKALTDRGQKVLVVREPGGTPVGESLRTILKGEHKELNIKLEPSTELLLFFASRMELIHKVILPNVREGVIVIADRFLLSTVAYQGYGLGLLPQVTTLMSWVTTVIRPDLSILLDIPVEEIYKRMPERNEADVIEKRGPEYFSRVRKGFLVNNLLEFSDVKVLNGLVEPETVLLQTLSKIDQLLN